MNQKDLIEMHTSLMHKGCEIQASEHADIWLYIFTRKIGEDTYIVELKLNKNAYIVITTINTETCKDLTNTFSTYEQSIYGMEDICNRLEQII